MDHLQGAGTGKAILPAAADGLGGGQAENRPNPLAAGEQAISDRLVDDLRTVFRPGEKPLQGGVDKGLPFREIGFQRGPFS
jgi:hypothetical protein